MDRELNNGIIVYNIYINKSLRKKKKSVYKIRKGFP